MSFKVGTSPYDSLSFSLISVIMDETCFKSHFLNKRSLAATYLLTVAAKALFYDAKGVDHELAIENMKVESTLNTSMRNEEISKTFLSKISSPEGIRVRKRGRNGYFRNIVIRMESKNSDLSYCSESKSYTADSCYLIWKSYWMLKKKFALTKLSVIVQPSNVNDITESIDQSNLNFSSPKINNEALTQSPPNVNNSSVTSKSSPLPFVRLTNESRHIDIQFESFDDYDGCIKCMSKFTDR